ncbi:b(0 +)-type amino acid transporter 1 [Biomphalaria glabrata]
MPEDKLTNSTSPPEEVHIDQEKVVLKKELGFVGATSIVVGTIVEVEVNLEKIISKVLTSGYFKQRKHLRNGITCWNRIPGSGIFVSPKGVLENTGSVGLCLVVWAVAGVVSLGSALCYAELGAMIPLSGGIYTYLRLGLGNIAGFICVIERFFVADCLGILIMLLTFSKYTVSILPTCGSPQLLEKMIAATTLVGLTLINSYSSKLATRVSILTTFGKVAALIVICVGGVVFISKGVTTELPSGFSGTKSDPASIALAFYSALFAYDGASHLNSLIEEVKSPVKTVPRAILFGTFLIIVIYIMTNVSYLAVMTRSELLGSNAVASLFADKVLSSASILIPLAVMISTLGSSNNSILSNNRIIFSAARDGNLPDFLSYVQVSQLTPFSALSATAILSLLYLVPADLGQFINFGGFLQSLFEAGVFLSLILLRLRTKKYADRKLKV